jgi:hypothetical protein
VRVTVYGAIEIEIVKAEIRFWLAKVRGTSFAACGTLEECGEGRQPRRVSPPLQCLRIHHHCLPWKSSCDTALPLGQIDTAIRTFVQRSLEE